MEKRQKSWLRLIIGMVILIVLLLVLYRSIDLEILIESFNNFNEFWIPVIIGCSLCIIISKGFRFYLLMKANNIPITFWRAIRVFSASQIMTPLPAGEAFRVALLRLETSTEKPVLVGITLTQALLEIMVGSLIMIGGSFFIEDLRTGGVIALLILVCLFTIIFNVKKIAEKVTTKYFIQKSVIFLSNWSKEIRIQMFRPHSFIPKRDFIISAAWTVITNIFGGLLLLVIAEGFGVHLNILFAILIYSTTIVAQGLLSFIPAGIGVIEGGLTGLLLFSQIELHQAVAVTIIFRVSTLLLSVAIGGILVLFFYRKRLVKQLL